MGHFCFDHRVVKILEKNLFLNVFFAMSGARLFLCKTVTIIAVIDLTCVALMYKW